MPPPLPPPRQSFVIESETPQPVLPASVVLLSTGRKRTSSADGVAADGSGDGSCKRARTATSSSFVVSLVSIPSAVKAHIASYLCCKEHFRFANCSSALQQISIQFPSSHPHGITLLCHDRMRLYCQNPPTPRYHFGGAWWAEFGVATADRSLTTR